MDKDIDELNKETRSKEKIEETTDKKIYTFLDYKECANFIKANYNDDIRVICLDSNLTNNSKNLYIVGNAFSYKHLDLFNKGIEMGLIKKDADYNKVSTIYTMPLFEYEKVKNCSFDRK